MDFSAIKQKSKADIKGKIGVLFLITLILGAVSLAAGALGSLIPVIGPAISTFIITPAFSLSLARVYLMVVRSKEVKAADAFCGFKDFWGAFKVIFLTGLYTFLWSLLFFIPGIIKTCAYSLSLTIFVSGVYK